MTFSDLIKNFFTHKDFLPSADKIPGTLFTPPKARIEILPVTSFVALMSSKSTCRSFSAGAAERNAAQEKSAAVANFFILKNSLLVYPVVINGYRTHQFFKFFIAFDVFSRSEVARFRIGTQALFALESIVIDQNV